MAQRRWRTRLDGRPTRRRTHAMNVGRIVRVVGPVIDVEFPADAMPAIYNALKVDVETPDRARRPRSPRSQQHLEGNQVRAVAMSSTDGMHRGMEASTPARPCRCRWARRRSAASSTSSARRRRQGGPVTPRTATRSTARRRSTRTSSRRPRSSRPASRSSTCSSPTSRAARSACSAAPAWARPSSSWSSSTTSPGARRHVGVRRRGRAHP